MNSEVSGVEPLHDIAGHIKNIIEEIKVMQCLTNCFRL